MRRARGLAAWQGADGERTSLPQNLRKPQMPAQSHAAGRRVRWSCVTQESSTTRHTTPGDRIADACRLERLRQVRT